jgi:predicted DCC family thiol-disulfide oxidoreductase YuxK
MGSWLVLYDADCGLCKFLLALLLRWDRSLRLRPVALQRARAATLLADLDAAERMDSWHLIAPSGERSSGGAALAPLFAQLPGGRLPGAVAARFPGAAGRGYRAVADHRAALSRLVPASFKRRAEELVVRREGATSTPA